MSLPNQHRVKLVTSDAQTIEFSCRESEDVISAAERADVYLNAQCHAGTCGACVAHAKGGYYRLEGYSQDALPEQLRAQGKVLMCRTRPTGDLELELPYAYGLVRFDRPPTRTGRVVEKRWLTPDTIGLRIQLDPDDDGGTAFLFEPGQFVTLGVPERGLERPYSLANAPGWDGVLDFLIRLRTGGAFSGWLRDLCDVDQVLEVKGPYGTFTLQERGLRPRIFVAGGCGLASVLSMTRHMVELQEPQPSKLLFGVWREEEIFYQQELDQLAQELTGLSVTICVAEPSASWTGFRGSVVDAVEEAIRVSAETPDIYICGSAGLVEAIRARAQTLAVPEENLYYERYTSANHRPFP